MRYSPASLALFGVLVLAGSRAPLATPAGQEAQRGPTVFRHLVPGELFPALEVEGPRGEQRSFEPSRERPCLVAFLRPDQEGSARLLRGIEALALDPQAPSAQLVIIGMHGREAPGWRKLTKALPRKIELLFDRGRVGKQLGIIVLPTVAVLDGDGRLDWTHVLFDDGLMSEARRELKALVDGGPVEADPEVLARRRFAALTHNAAALESAGKLEDALNLRRRLLDTGLEPALTQAELGRTLLWLGEAKEAVMHLSASAELDDRVSTRVWLGMALARTGAEQDAERILLEVLPLTPMKSATHRELAELYKRRGDLPKAIEHLKAAIAALRSPGSEADDE
jgi:hypothetical protein